VNEKFPSVSRDRVLDRRGDLARSSGAFQGSSGIGGGSTPSSILSELALFLVQETGSRLYTEQP